MPYGGGSAKKVRLTKRRRKRYTAKAVAGRAAVAAVRGSSLKAIGSAVGGVIERQAARRVAGKIIAPIVTAASIGSRALSAGAAAAGTTLPALGLAALVGVAAYEGTTWLLDEAQSGAFDPAFRAAMAYRHARDALRRDLGRKLTMTEERALAVEFKKQLKKVGPYKGDRVLKL